MAFVTRRGKPIDGMIGEGRALAIGFVAADAGRIGDGFGLAAAARTERQSQPDDRGRARWH